MHDPENNRKFSAADIKEGEFRKQYRRAYQECISTTSTGDAPWFVVPADDKGNARLIVSQIVLYSLAELTIVSPKASEARRRELQEIREERLDSTKRS